MTPGLRAFEITPVKPTFTHTLEPARPVQGRVTDKETGKPLAGLARRDDTDETVMAACRFVPAQTRPAAFASPGMAVPGRILHAVYPPADSGYLTASNTDSEWPAGAKFLEKNFALEKGRIVRGQVIDADTKQPIAMHRRRLSTQTRQSQ